MPRPRPDDPHYCPGSGSSEFTDQLGWAVCPRCTRALVATKTGRLGAHRVRSRSTRSLDATRDILVAANVDRRQLRGDPPDQAATTEPELVYGPVKVSFVQLGEGRCGDYDPNDPDDVELLRIDLLVSRASGYPGEDTDDPDWRYPDQGSICTQIPTSTAPVEQARLLRLAAAELRDCVESGASVKHLMDRLSWLPGPLPPGLTARLTASLPPTG